MLPVVAAHSDCGKITSMQSVSLSQRAQKEEDLLVTQSE
jgi:hypothetical protein